MNTRTNISSPNYTRKSRIAVATNVKNLLAVHGYTLADLARKFDTSRSAISQVAAGDSGRVVDRTTKAGKIRSWICRKVKKKPEELWPDLGPVKWGRPRRTL